MLSRSKVTPCELKLRSALGSSETKSVLLFVHGFNTTFTDVALRTAQLAHDLSFRGLPLFFSWPSAGSTRSYFQDEEMAQLSVPPFNQLLTRLPHSVQLTCMSSRIVWGIEL